MIRAEGAAIISGLFPISQNLDPTTDRLYALIMQKRLALILLGVFAIIGVVFLVKTAGCENMGGTYNYATGESTEECRDGAPKNDSNDKESGSIKFCGFTSMEASDLWNKVDRNLDTPDNRARYLTYLYYIAENSDCFSSLVLAQAKTAVGQTILANEITAFYPVHY